MRVWIWAMLLVLGAATARADPITFDLPEGWSVERKTDRHSVSWTFTRDSNAYVERHVAEHFGLVDMLPLFDPVGRITEVEMDALESPLAYGMARVRIIVGRPPGMDMFDQSNRADWNSLSDVWTYIDKWESKNSDYFEQSLNGWKGVSYTSKILPSRVYQLIYAPGTRLFISVKPAKTLHWAEVDALLASLKPAQ